MNLIRFDLQVLLARHKAEQRLYAVKVLNKSHIVKKNETTHVMAERNVLICNVHHPFLIGLHYSFQTSDKLYFVVDYVNGGEVRYRSPRTASLSCHSRKREEKNDVHDGL